MCKLLMEGLGKLCQRKDISKIPSQVLSQVNLGVCPNSLFTSWPHLHHNKQSVTNELYSESFSIPAHLISYFRTIGWQP